jgi:hypothetical protein
MAKKKKEKSKTPSPGRWSRIGLPVALIAILGLAALSFISLGMLKRNAALNAPKPQVESKLSSAVMKEEVESPTPIFPPPPPVLTAETGPAPGEAPAADAAGRPTESASSPPDKPAIETKVPESTPETESVRTAAVTPDPPPDQADPEPPQPAPTTIPSPPPDESTATSTEEIGDEIIPRPRWQTIGQEWEGSKPATDPETIQPGAAAWKQINIGEQDRVAGETEKAAMPKAPVVTAKQPVAPAVTTAPKTPTSSAKTVSPKTTKSPAKPTVRSQPTRRSSGQAAPRTSPIPRVGLVIINETGKPGQGEAYRNVLQAMGYRVDRVVDGNRKSGPTTILYGAGLADSAAKLASHIPGERAISPQATGGVDIVILVR